MIITSKLPLATHDCCKLQFPKLNKTKRSKVKGLNCFFIWIEANQSSWRAVESDAYANWGRIHCASFRKDYISFTERVELGGQIILKILKFLKSPKNEHQINIWTTSARRWCFSIRLRNAVNLQKDIGKALLSRLQFLQTSKRFEVARYHQVPGRT